jgi:hypothetical protein
VKHPAFAVELWALPGNVLIPGVFDDGHQIVRATGGIFRRRVFRLLPPLVFDRLQAGLLLEAFAEVAAEHGER